jgi:hypothetical protein
MEFHADISYSEILIKESHLILSVVFILSNANLIFSCCYILINLCCIAKSNTIFTQMQD